MTAVSTETPSPVAGFFADPSLTVVDGTYLLYATTDGSADWSNTSFRLFTSGDLVTWEDSGVVFDVRESGWASGHAWAPAHVERDGKHYLYYTADRGCIGVAVADAADGPFIDLGRPLIQPGDFPGVAIDPSIFIDIDDVAYLYWGNTVAHGVALDATMTSFEAHRVKSWVPENFREAISVHRHSDLYYASWSVDDTRSDDYHVEYATAGSPLGPWTHGGILLQKDADRGILATGHHCVVRVMRMSGSSGITASQYPTETDITAKFDSIGSFIDRMGRSSRSRRRAFRIGIPSRRSPAAPRSRERKHCSASWKSNPIRPCLA